MKLVLKILGGFVLVLVLAGVGGYLFLLSPPSPESVCDNMVNIVKTESGSNLPSSYRDDCIKKAGTPPTYGRLPWVAQLKCMRDAKTSAELKACDRR